MNRETIDGKFTEIKQIHKDLYEHYNSRNELEYTKSAIEYSQNMKDPGVYFDMIKAYDDNKYVGVKNEYH